MEIPPLTTLKKPYIRKDGGALRLLIKRASPLELYMAVVITEIATPRKVKIALLTLLLFAAMC